VKWKEVVVTGGLEDDFALDGGHEGGRGHRLSMLVMVIVLMVMVMVIVVVVSPSEQVE
jgi:hypothetical protein